jgi:hypothetical protein
MQLGLGHCEKVKPEITPIITGFLQVWSVKALEQILRPKLLA